jgi:hypothetical protein
MSESNHIHLPSYPLTRTPISRMLHPLWLTIYRMTRRMRQVGWYFPIQFGDPANAAIYNRFIICCVIGIQKSFSMEAFLVTKVPYLVMSTAVPYPFFDCGRFFVQWGSFIKCLVFGSVYTGSSRSIALFIVPLPS